MDTVFRGGFESCGKLDGDLKTLQKKGGKCVVCGIGSAFIALVDLGNKMETQADMISEFFYVSDSLMRKKLAKVFTPIQIGLIESAFEEGHCVFKQDGIRDSYDEIENRAVDFGRQYKSHNFRLVAIMENIIKNKGEFKP